MPDLLDRLLVTSTLVSISSSVVLFLFASALLLNDWKVGLAMHDGRLRDLHVGLVDVHMFATDASGEEETESLQQLCDSGDADDDDDLDDWSRQNVADLPGFEMSTRRWCQLAYAGSSANSFVLLAWLPALAVFGWSTMRTLRNMLPPEVEPLLAKLERLCPAERHAELAVAALWSVYWLILMVAITMYASNTPGSFGLGAASFGQSFELFRCCVLLSSLLAVALVARSLGLWDSQTVKEVAADIMESRTLKRVLYVLLLLQVALYLVVSLVDIQFSAVICFLGLNYLATKSLQMLWGWHALNLVHLLAYSSLVLVFACKGVLLAGMLALHLRFNFRLNFRSSAEPQPQRLHDEEEMGA